MESTSTCSTGNLWLRFHIVDTAATLHSTYLGGSSRREVDTSEHQERIWSIRKNNTLSPLHLPAFFELFCFCLLARQLRSASSLILRLSPSSIFRPTYRQRRAPYHNNIALEVRILVRLTLRHSLHSYHCITLLALELPAALARLVLWHETWAVA